MTVRLAPAGRPAPADGDGLDHLYCCDPDLALCGIDISGHHEDDSLPGTCVVCLALEFAACSCHPAA